MRWNFRDSIVAAFRWLGGVNQARRPLALSYSPAETAMPGARGEPQPASPADAAPDRSTLARVFDSAHPVRTRAELFGRQRELDDLLSATFDFGQHAMVHGARGSGKTSLVRVFGDYADQKGAVVIYLACEPGASFAELLRPYLIALPSSAFAPGARARFQNDLAALPEHFGPRAFVDLVAESIGAPTMLIFDEFDRITDPAVKADMAAAMKLLSDSLSPLLFILVGIARDVSDMIASHASLRRHMCTVSLGRIEPRSVGALLDAGQAAVGLQFEAEARTVIIRAACGSPFHVRLFCHHAALWALRRSATRVGGEDARAGLATALKQWAAMNAGDARTFVKLVESGRGLDALERIARTAAMNDRIEGDSAGNSAMLGDALGREPGAEDALVFLDSVAPQFLIAYIIVAEAQAVPIVARPKAKEAIYAVNR